MGNVIFLDRSNESASSREIRLSSSAGERRLTDDLSAYSRNFWLRTVRQRLNQLLQMRPGWDGYRAARISYDTAIFASQILQDLWQRNLKTPEISPLSNGGLMVEWISDSGELTLEIDRPYVVSMIHESQNGDEVDEPVGADLSGVAKKLEAMFASPFHISVVA